MKAFTVTDTSSGLVVSFSAVCTTCRTGQDRDRGRRGRREEGGKEGEERGRERERERG